MNVLGDIFHWMRLGGTSAVNVRDDSTGTSALVDVRRVEASKHAYYHQHHADVHLLAAATIDVMGL